MRKTIRKWFWVWDFDKEVSWLNEMAAKGLQLVSVGFCKYIFDEGMPGEYTIGMEMLDNAPTHPESVQYIKFVEDTGAEYLGSVFRVAYFRKKSLEGSFSLFSDIESRIKHLNRILILLGALFFASLPAVLSNFILYFSGIGIKLNLGAGIASGLLALLIMYGLIEICMEKNKLKKDRALHE